MNDSSFAQDFGQLDWPTSRQLMIENQIRPRGVKDIAVLEAIGRIPRELFVPDEIRAHAYDDGALSVGFGQTISQPFIVAYMTERLEANRTCRVLEIGTGTGYQTAVLAAIAAHVLSVERITELHEQAYATLRRLGVTNVSLFVGDGTLGLPDHAPFDRIIITAAAPRVPTSLVDQLSDDGMMILPVGGESEQTISRVSRHGSRTVETPLLACRFVKLIGMHGWDCETSKS